ncbi:MAG: sugar transferase [Peptococcaceae bacterium]|nr:sugar transferase [Peptococcaceae bacterium]
MRAYLFFKRLFDFCASALALVVTSPIWLITAIGIIISDPGPVFYLANRVGKDNKPFLMFKFRSMTVDKKANEKSLRADATRIFKFGSFIRATKIDELPQLLNVFLGQMSIVGPRPAAVDQLEITRAGKCEICSIAKPGLTSPSAIYDYIYGDKIEDEVEYKTKVLSTRLALDVWYVGHMNTKLDFKMIWYTVVSIISTMGERFPENILTELQNYVRSSHEASI